MQVEARQIDVGRVHVGGEVMPVPVMTAGPVVAHVMPVSPPAMPVMAPPVWAVPVLSVPPVWAPVTAVPVPPVRAVRPRVVFSPVMPMLMVPVPVMRRVDPRARGRHHRHRDEKRQAGCEESEELIP